MSLKPIDLQTLFSHLNQVGKEQAVAKEASAVQQSQQGENLMKRAEEQRKKVKQTDDPDTGPEKVNEDERKENEKGRQQERHEKRDQEKNEKKRDELFKDPDLGQHLDISG